MIDENGGFGRRGGEKMGSCARSQMTRLASRFGIFRSFCSWHILVHEIVSRISGNGGHFQAWEKAQKASEDWRQLIDLVQ